MYINKKILRTITLSLSAVVLASCGQNATSSTSESSVKTEKKQEQEVSKPLAISEAFKTEGIWYRTKIEKGYQLDKNAEIFEVVAFDGKGNAVFYKDGGNTPGKGLTLKDVANKSDSEVLELVKKNSLKNYDEKKSGYVKSQENASMPADKKVMSDQAVSKIKNLHYKEAVLVPYKLSAKTDNTGNNVKSETIVAEYKEIRFDIVWQKYMNCEELGNLYWYANDDKFGTSEEKLLIQLIKDLVIELDENGYSNKKFVAIAKSFISNQRVFDSLFSGFTDGSDAFVTKVKDGHKGFAFDNPKTEGIEIG